MYPYQLPLAPPPPDEPPPKLLKLLLPENPPLLPPPGPEDLVFLGIITIFLSWKLQYLQVLSTSFLPEAVYEAAFRTFVFIVSAQNLLHSGHLLLNRFIKNIIKKMTINIGKQHIHAEGILEKKLLPEEEYSSLFTPDIPSSSSPYI